MKKIVTPQVILAGLTFFLTPFCVIWPPVVNAQSASPREQAQEKQCREGLELVIRTNGKLACVTPKTAQKWIARGIAQYPPEPTVTDEESIVEELASEESADTQEPTGAAPASEEAIVSNGIVPPEIPEPARSRTFVVVPEASKASYIVNEEFLGGALEELNISPGPVTAVGTTQQVEGQLQLNSDDLNAPHVLGPNNFTVNIESLTSDDERRDDRIREHNLESSKYPLATFTATTIENAPTEYAKGEEIKFRLLGDLTVRATNLPVTFDVTATLIDTLADTVIEGEMSTKLQMTDFGFEPPDWAGIRTVENDVMIVVEFKMVEGGIREDIPEERFIEPPATALPPATTISPTVPAAAPIDGVTLALDAVGGPDALGSLVAYTYEANGMRFVLDESFSTDDEPEAYTPYTVQAAIDLPSNSFRLDYVRSNFGISRTVSEIVAGNAGYIDGADINFAPPYTIPMTADRLAVTQKQMRLFNPHLLLKEAAANPSLVRTTQDVMLNGGAHTLVEVTDEVSPIMLFISKETGRISKLTTKEHDPVRRDVVLEVAYADWQNVNGIWFPSDVTLTLAGDTMQTEQRSNIVVNPTLDAAALTVPPELAIPWDGALAARGRRMSQFIYSFVMMGWLKDGAHDEINAEEIAPGIYHILDTANHSMVVEQENGIVIVEGALYSTRAEAIIGWVNETFPDKPISYAVSTHHHVDHAGGLRPFAARGATIVVHEATESYYQKLFARRGATILPDVLDSSTQNVELAIVPAAGSYVIADRVRPITVYPAPSTHAESMMIIVVQPEGIVFVSDIYAPGRLPPGEGAVEFNDAVVATGEEIELVVGGHGGTITYGAFLNELRAAGLGAD